MLRTVLMFYKPLEKTFRKLQPRNVSKCQRGEHMYQPPVLWKGGGYKNKNKSSTNREQTLGVRSIDNLYGHTSNASTYCTSMGEISKITSQLIPGKSDTLRINSAKISDNTRQINQIQSSNIHSSNKDLSPLPKIIEDDVYDDFRTQERILVIDATPTFSVDPSVSPFPPEGRVQASPYAHRLAAERGVDLAAINEGSGLYGSITSRDVDRVCFGATDNILSFNHSDDYVTYLSYS